MSNTNQFEKMSRANLVAFMSDLVDDLAGLRRR